MIKIILKKIISLVFLIIILSGCSASENSSPNDQSGTNFVTGEILMVNNEPFARVAIMNDTTLYLLDCPKEVNETLSKNQGRTAKVYYNSVSTNNESIKVLKVDKIEIEINK